MTACDSALSALRGHIGELETALAIWETRDDTKAQPDVRQAANDAVDAIDGALRELHGIRAGLISEIRSSDDAAMVRAEELLRRILEEHAQITVACRAGRHLECVTCGCGCHHGDEDGAQ